MTQALIRPRIEYYAWRHLPFWEFQGLDILTTVFDTLVRIPSEVREPHVAHQKLAFFHSDILRAHSGTPHHPAVQALAALMKTDPLRLEPFEDICTAMETEIDRIQSIDARDLDRYCKRKRGAFLLLCAELLKKAPLTDAEASAVEHLGIFIERKRLLLNRETHPEQSHLFPLKDSSMEAHFDPSLCHDACTPIYLLAKLYDDLPATPLQLLMRSLYYRIRGH